LDYEAEVWVFKHWIKLSQVVASLSYDALSPRMVMLNEIELLIQLGLPVICPKQALFCFHSLKMQEDGVNKQPLFILDL
jgi:hypothetical protein